jgi:hypothetical protein
MSALLVKLAQNGVSNEDLEKAAALNLFAKVAEAEGINLDALNDTQLEALYSQFETEVLPGLVGGGAATVEDKLASLSQDDVFALFEKQAAAEGFSDADLQAVPDANLQQAFDHFVENVLPEMAANGWEPVMGDKAASAQVEEAQAKLAEADILGRHMANSFHDQLNKLAAELPVPLPGAKSKGARFAESVDNRLRQAGALAKKYPKTTAGLAAGGATLGAAGVAARMKKNSEKAASSPAFEALAMQKAAEILEAHGIDPATGAAKEASFDELVEARAAEILEANGYTFGG